MLPNPTVSFKTDQGEKQSHGDGLKTQFPLFWWERQTRQTDSHCRRKTKQKQNSGEATHCSCIHRRSIFRAGLFSFKSRAVILRHQHHHPPLPLKVPSWESIRKFIKLIPKTMYIINSFLVMENYALRFHLTMWTWYFRCSSSWAAILSWCQGKQVRGDSFDCVLMKLICKILFFLIHSIRKHMQAHKSV